LTGFSLFKRFSSTIRSVIELEVNTLENAQGDAHKIAFENRGKTKGESIAHWGQTNVTYRRI
jgi:hypothetical protein